MAKKPETKFRIKFQNRLKKLPNSWFESIQQKSIGGTPDNLGVVRGHFVAIEYKASESDLPTELQKLKLGKIKTAGGTSLVVCPENADDMFNCLLTLSKGKL